MEFVKAAAEDAYDRLIYPSLEREMRAALTDKASEGAIKMFAWLCAWSSASNIRNGRGNSCRR